MKQPFEIFKAFADETRLRILSLLSHKPMCVRDLDLVLRVGQSKVSRHLDYLKKHALVTSNRQGNLNVYSLDLEDETPAHKILEIWKGWAQRTETGQADWKVFEEMNSGAIE